MKNFLYLAFSFVLIIASIYMLIPLFYANKIPSIKYLDINEKEINLSDINLNNKQTYIFYVSPTCEYCSDINNLLDTLSDSKFNKIIICSSEENVNYAMYKNKFNLNNENYFLIDTKNNFAHDFKINTNYSLPLIIKYDKKGIKMK